MYLYLYALVENNHLSCHSVGCLNVKIEFESNWLSNLFGKVE